MVCALGVPPNNELLDRSAESVSRNLIGLFYVYLVEHDVESAVQRMREALLNFLEHNVIPRSRFHETITRAWVLAVRHFMNGSTSTSSADFIAKNPELLDSKIMLTHYSASVLFSSDARRVFRGA